MYSRSIETRELFRTIPQICDSTYPSFHIIASSCLEIHEGLFGADYQEVNIGSEENVMTADILRTPCTADQGGKHLKKSVQDIVGERGWTENIAKAILGGADSGLKQGVQIGKAMKEASEKSFR